MSLVHSNKRFMLIPALPVLAVVGIVIPLLTFIVWIPRLFLGFPFWLASIGCAVTLDREDPFDLWRYHSNYNRFTQFLAELTAWMWPWLR